MNDHVSLILLHELQKGGKCVDCRAFVTTSLIKSIVEEHQDFHSLFCQHIKAYVQSLSIIGSLVDNLSRLAAWPVSQIIVFRRIRLLRKFYYLMNIFSKKYVVCICNISTKKKMCRLHDGIKRKDCTIILT